MKNRRGSLWGTDMSGDDMVSQYKVGDLVKPVAVTDHGFVGVVRAVDPRINKVTVAWGGGSMKQHDPDEIMLEVHQSPLVRDRMASGRRTKKADADFFSDRTAGEGFEGARRGRMASISDVRRALKDLMDAEGEPDDSASKRAWSKAKKALASQDEQAVKDAMEELMDALGESSDTSDARRAWSKAKRLVGSVAAAEECGEEEGPRVACRRGRM